jgi:superfamily II DNA/RNA helicase
VLGALPPRVRRVLVGATVGQAVARAVESKAIELPLLVDGGGDARSWEEDDLAQALCPPGIVHRFCVAPESGDQSQAQLQLLALARLLRRDLSEWMARCEADEGVPRPRAVVFAADEPAALRVGSALRESLWGEQAVVTRAGAQPDQSAAAFQSRRANAGKQGFDDVLTAGGASVLVVPKAEGRGLDFPDVTHVYCFNLDLEAAEAHEYAHMAGRTGRVGQGGHGLVTSVLNADPEWPSVLAALSAIVCVVARDPSGQGLGAVAMPSVAEDEDVRQGLNDLLALTEEREPSE